MICVFESAVREFTFNFRVTTKIAAIVTTESIVISIFEIAAPKEVSYCCNMAFAVRLEEFLVAVIIVAFDSVNLEVELL